jgi:AcrR family transcriptional regulator
MTKTTPDQKPDGRIQRSERSRQLIIDSMLELMQEGNLVPTAQQVAERAEVGIRTVFRHFNDMESLFKTMDQATRESYSNLFIGGDRHGTLEQRILHVTERHASAFEAIRPIILSTQAQMWRFEILQKNYARSQKALRNDTRDWLPEILKLPQISQQLVEAVVSFEFWDRLRTHQGLNKKKTIDAIVFQLQLLIPEGQACTPVNTSSTA